MSATEGQTIIRRLPVVLNTDEFEAKAAEMAAICLEIENLNEEKKATAADFKAKIDKKVSAHSELAVIVNSRSEYRDVDCYERLNPERKVMEIIRADTGEMVDTRGLTSRDIQDALGFMKVGEEEKDE